MKKTLASLLCAAVLAATLAGCGGAEKYASSTAAVAEAAGAMEMGNDSAAAMDGSGVQTTLTPQSDSERKIVYTAFLRMESTEFDRARDALLAAVEAHGAYLQSTDQSGSAREGSRRVYYTVRVPAGAYTAFLEQAGQAGSVLSMNESAEDITLEYVDVQARLESLENQKRRLEALADRAETTADLLEIESQLSEVQYQLESYTRQMKLMDNRVAYCTVDISLAEVATLTPTGVTFGERAADALTGGWAAFTAFLQDAVIGILYSLPALVLLAAAGGLLAAALHRRRAHKAARRAAAKTDPPKDSGETT